MVEQMLRLEAVILEAMLAGLMDEVNFIMSCDMPLEQYASAIEYVINNKEAPNG